MLNSTSEKAEGIFRKKGIVSINIDYLKRHPGKVKKILKDVIILKTEVDLFRNIILYHGVCEDFYIVDDQEPMQYWPDIDEDGNANFR